MLLLGSTSVFAQWSTTTFPSAFTNKKVEIGPLPEIPDAWVNTYSDNCVNMSSGEDAPTMPLLESNHIRIRQRGEINIAEDNFINDPNQGSTMDCTLVSDYYFKTTLDHSKLIISGVDNTGQPNMYMSFWKQNIRVHQPVLFEQGMTSSGYSSFANLFATSFTAANSSFGDMTVGNLTVDNLVVNSRPTFNNGLKIKNSSLQITDANDNIIWNFRNDGKLGIGVATSEMNGPYWLWVKQGIMTERIKVAVKGTNDWADYVFSPQYKLMNLSDLETYISANKHLPDVPSAEDVVKEGIDLQKMDATLLQKIEELTLYVIELKKEINSLKSIK